MATLDKILDEITRLDEEAQEMLLEIVRKRQIEKRRKEIQANSRKAKREFAGGKLKPLSAKEVIRQLNKE